MCSTHWSDLLTEGVSRNPKLSAAEKAAEIARAVRRTESFVDIMLPPVDAAGRMINCAAQADSAAPAADRRRATAHAHPLPPVHGAAPGSAASTGVPSTPPAFAASGIGSGAAAAGGPPSSVGPAATGRRPVSDPRRNSMMLLKKFVSANSKPKQQQQPQQPGQPPQAQPAPVANSNGNGLVGHGPHGGVPLSALSGSAGGSQVGVVRHYSVQPSRSSRQDAPFT